MYQHFDKCSEGGREGEKDKRKEGGKGSVIRLLPGEQQWLVVVACEVGAYRWKHVL